MLPVFKGKAKYQWSHCCQEAFDNVKSVLCSPPVLAAPHMDQPFLLHVDAIDVGAGAVLFQCDDNGVERPVSFFSKKCNSSKLFCDREGDTCTYLGVETF